MEITPGLFAAVAAIALVSQYMSVSIGVGYGTILTPLLLILGFSALQIIPAVLLSQFVGGVVGGLAHYWAGNITLDFRRDDRLIKKRLGGLGYLPRSIDSKVIFVLVACGVIGVVVGVLVATNIPQVALKTYIGVMILGVGIVVLSRRGHEGAFSWKGLFAFGLLGAFNKGVSGGGYVPLVAGGQIMIGRGTKSSIGSTTLAVTIISAIGFLGYLLIIEGIDWILTAATIISSVIAAPFAAVTVRKLSPEKLRVVIGLATLVLGALTLVRVFIF
ncbi:TSUP family transporter [Chloroflexota bacterium]